jgi:hypothetical protein
MVRASYPDEFLLKMFSYVYFQGEWGEMGREERLGGLFPFFLVGGGINK